MLLVLLLIVLVLVVLLVLLVLMLLVCRIPPGAHAHHAAPTPPKKSFVCSAGSYCCPDAKVRPMSPLLQALLLTPHFSSYRNA